MDVLELPSMSSLPLDLALPSPWDSDRVMAEAVFGPCSGDAGAQRRGVSGCVIIMYRPPADPHVGCRPADGLAKALDFSASSATGPQDTGFYGSGNGYMAGPCVSGAVLRPG